MPLPKTLAAAPSLPIAAAPLRNPGRAALFADSVARSWLFSFAFRQPERLAPGDRRYQGRKAIISRLNLLHHLIDRTTVMHGKFPTQAERKHFFGQATHKFRPSLVQNLGQGQRTVELCSTRQLARSIDRKGSVLIAPPTNCVEILQSKAELIHRPMARRTHWILAVYLKLLP